MRNKNLKIHEIQKWGHYLREQWRIHFASHLTEDEQLAIGMDGFLWHLCSWEKVQCLKGEQAIAAFQKQEKQKCTIFYQFINDAYLVESAHALELKDLPYQANHMYLGDLYVMDWDNKWTFMLTHESQCGPYFITKG